jgi:hypothetical protein
MSIGSTPKRNCCHQRLIQARRLKSAKGIGPDAVALGFRRPPVEGFLNISKAEATTFRRLERGRHISQQGPAYYVGILHQFRFRTGASSAHPRAALWGIVSLCENALVADLPLWDFTLLEVRITLPASHPAPLALICSNTRVRGHACRVQLWGKCQ